MNARKLQHALTDFFAGHSGHDPDRDYLGMSQIALPEEKLLAQLRGDRWVPSTEDHLKLRLGHLHEAEIKAALEHLGHYASPEISAGWLYDPTEKELVADFDSRFRGHTDGQFVTHQGEEHVLCEIKSIGGSRDKGWPLDDIAYSDGMPRQALPEKHFAQVQMYMRHGGYERCWMIYVCRSRGLIWTCEVLSDAAMQYRLDAKAKRVLERFDARRAVA